MGQVQPPDMPRHDVVQHAFVTDQFRKKIEQRIADLRRMVAKERQISTHRLHTQRAISNQIGAAMFGAELIEHALIVFHR